MCFWWTLHLDNKPLGQKINFSQIENLCSVAVLSTSTFCHDDENIYFVGENSKYVSKDGSDTGNPTSKGSSTSVPTTSKSEGEILQSVNLNGFTYNELKNATRNFRPDSVLGEGGFGSVFKGWVDEHSLAASRPGIGIVVAVKRLNQDGLQGHKEWLVCKNCSNKSSYYLMLLEAVAIFCFDLRYTGRN